MRGKRATATAVRARHEAAEATKAAEAIIGERANLERELASARHEIDWLRKQMTEADDRRRVEVAKAVQAAYAEERLVIAHHRKMLLRFLHLVPDDTPTCESADDLALLNLLDPTWAREHGVSRDTRRNLEHATRVGPMLKEANRVLGRNADPLLDATTALAMRYAREAKMRAWSDGEDVEFG